MNIREAQSDQFFFNPLMKLTSESEINVYPNDLDPDLKKKTNEDFRIYITSGIIAVSKLYFLLFVLGTNPIDSLKNKNQ